MLAVHLAFQIYMWVRVGVCAVIGVAGLAGAATVLATRADAFDAAGRQSRWTWAGLLALSGICVALQLPMLLWVGMVVIGVYWFDVRPQIKSLLDGSASAW